MFEFVRDFVHESVKKPDKFPRIINAKVPFIVQEDKSLLKQAQHG